MFGFTITNYFLDPANKLWFWLLVPFILLYLIRPKPISQTIPSLMFLLQDKGRAFKNSFLKYLYRDFVFFIQLIVLTLLVAAACQPFISVQKTSLVGNAVIVLDASASMQANDGRWDAAINQAKASLASQNTIILVLNRPVIVAKQVNRGDAENVLNTLKPYDTETNLYAAIIAAREFAPDADTVVTVISDFRNTDEQQDYSAALKAVASSGASTKTVQVGGAVKNVGIVSVDVKDDKTIVGITNYEDESVVVNLQAANFSQAVPLGTGSTDYVTINTPAGITRLTIDPHDDFSLDDQAYIANNPNLLMKLLIVTNNQNIKQTPFWYALQSINDKTPLKLQVDINTPPTLADVSGYDAVIFADVDPQFLVQRIVRETADQVQQGKAAIIMSQSDMFAIDYAGMLTYTYNASGGASAISSADALTNSIEFGDTQGYMIVSGTGRVLAQAADGTPLVSVMPDGKGKVLYYGIPDNQSSFPYEPYYPVFWRIVLDELAGRASVNNLNYQTGSTPTLSGSVSSAPSNLVYQGYLDKQGVYTIGGYDVVANLESTYESQASASPINDTQKTLLGTTQDTTKQKELTSLFILVALILLLVELFIVKFRGDF